MGSRAGRPAQDIRRLLREQGLVCTAQRELVARAVFEMGSHVGAEELYQSLAGQNPRVGLATVYRTLQLLKDKGLIAERQFGDRWRRYENSGGDHHDHLICLSCGAVLEFQEPMIEDLQDRVARRHGFVPDHHRLELYGYCRSCARERRR